MLYTTLLLGSPIENCSTIAWAMQFTRGPPRLDACRDVLDLDQLKSLNDAHGHTAGDAALKTIAQRLLQYVRDEDTVCRNGGDEFLYLLMNPRGKKNIEHIANSVLRTIAQPVAIAERELTVKASIGIAIYPEHGASGEQLIAKADAAMYLAKQRARGVAFFDRQTMRAISVGTN